MQPVLSQQPTSAAASAQQQPGTMMFSAKQAPFTLAAAVTMALQPIFLTLSKGPKGYFEYSVGSATLLCELLKLGFSSISLAIQLARNPELKSSVLSNRPWLEFAQFFVPSVIYFANNNLVFVILMVRGTPSSAPATAARRRRSPHPAPLLVRRRWTRRRSSWSLRPRRSSRASSSASC